MRRPSAALIVPLLLVLAATVAALDLRRVERNAIVVYTTPALKDAIEKAIVPLWQKGHATPISVVYLPAGDEYYRVLLTKDRPEADVFLHASPLFLEKGHEAGIFEAYPPPAGAQTSDTPQRRDASGNDIWAAFATSPLVEVFAQGKQAPDLNHTSLRFGMPHPLLSNNGIYAALFFESTSRVAGQKAVDLTVVQPTNAQANINGAADGSFDVTLGYEAVARLYQDKGAKVAYTFPILDGQNVTTPVLFSAGLVHNRPHPEANAFVDFLFNATVQGALTQYGLRATAAAFPAGAMPHGALDLGQTTVLSYDWARWRDLEGRLGDYVVRP